MKFRIVYSSTLNTHFPVLLIISSFTLSFVYFLVSFSLITTVFPINVFPPQFPSLNFISVMYFTFCNFPKERFLRELRLCRLCVSPVLDYGKLSRIKITLEWRNFSSYL